MTLIVIFRYC